MKNRRQKAYSDREMEKILKKNGYIFISQRGDHKKFEKDGRHVVINRNVNKMVCQRLIKENNLVINF